MTSACIYGDFVSSVARHRKVAAIIIFALTMVFGSAGCADDYSGPPKGAVVGRGGTNDYSPSVIQTGNVQQFWWCGEGHNPNKPSQDTDTIQYSTIDLTRRQVSAPITVMAETPGGWDSAYTCNPKVVRGSFVNPLGDGQTYTYAMYYVGTADEGGFANSIGVAFSNDGISWKKYPQPVISDGTQTQWGVGQPAVYNSDQKAGIWLFYEDLSTMPYKHVMTTSADGLHFTVQGNLTTNGLDPNFPIATLTWGDMAYDFSAGYWYAAFNMPLRASTSIDNIEERGQPGIQLYRIQGSSLLSGTIPWQQIKSFDTNITGYESNFIAGFLHDQYGNVNIGPYPTIQLFTSISNPKPAWNASPKSAAKSGNLRSWDIGTVKWVPNNPLIPFNRYFNGTIHQVTTGWIDPGANFKLEATLGHLYEAPQQGASVAYYGCKDGSADYFVSIDSTCAGKYVLGINGYGYLQPPPGITLQPLYTCNSGQDHLVSKDPKCEGEGTGSLLGYVVP